MEELINGLDFPDRQYQIFAAEDCDHLNRLTLANEPFVCRLCGSTLKWKPEGGETDLPRSWVCECGNDPLLTHICRQFDSVPHRLVGRAEEVFTD